MGGGGKSGQQRVPYFRKGRCPRGHRSGEENNFLPKYALWSIPCGGQALVKAGLPAEALALAGKGEKVR